MDVVLTRVSRLCRLSPPSGVAGARNFSTGVFANRSNNVKGKREKDTALAYVSEDIFSISQNLINLSILGFL